MFTHTEQNPHKCGICNKMLSQKSSLNKHIIIHIGDTQFDGNIGRRRFTRVHFLILKTTFGLV